MVRIARAAIRFKQLNSDRYSPTEYRIMHGWRHNEIFNEMKRNGIVYDRNDYETGFITNERPIHFVNRQEAAKIAYKAGQVPKLLKALYSEDLWGVNGYEK